MATDSTECPLDSKKEKYCFGRAHQICKSFRTKQKQKQNKQTNTANKEQHQPFFLRAASSILRDFRKREQDQNTRDQCANATSLARWSSPSTALRPYKQTESKKNQQRKQSLFAPTWFQDREIWKQFRANRKEERRDRPPGHPRC